MKGESENERKPIVYCSMHHLWTQQCCLVVVPGWAAALVMLQFKPADCNITSCACLAGLGCSFGQLGCVEGMEGPWGGTLGY